MKKSTKKKTTASKASNNAKTGGVGNGFILSPMSQVQLNAALAKINAFAGENYKQWKELSDFISNLDKKYPYLSIEFKFE